MPKASENLTDSFVATDILGRTFQVREYTYSFGENVLMQQYDGRREMEVRKENKKNESERND